MAKLSDYMRMINRFSKSMEKLLEEDFPGDEELMSKADNAMIQIHYAVLGALLKKGTN